MVPKNGFTMKIIFCNTGVNWFDAREIIVGKAKNVWVDTEETRIIDISSSAVFSFPRSPIL